MFALDNDFLNGVSNIDTGEAVLVAAFIFIFWNYIELKYILTAVYMVASGWLQLLG